jgi:hypothetical protein
MKMIPLKATKEFVDIKKNVVVYETDITTEGPGLIFNSNEGIADMILVQQIHEKGAVKVTAKPIRTPARKFNVGDVVGCLVLLE